MKSITQIVVIKRKLPGLNDIIDAAKKHHMEYSKLKKKWTRHCSTLFLLEKVKPVKSAFIYFEWMEKNPGKRDPDNIAAGGRKFILDGLVEAHVLRDDKSRYVRGWEDTFQGSHVDGVILKIVGRLA